MGDPDSRARGGLRGILPVAGYASEEILAWRRVLLERLIATVPIVSYRRTTHQNFGRIAQGSKGLGEEARSLDPTLADSGTDLLRPALTKILTGQVYHRVHSFETLPIDLSDSRVPGDLARTRGPRANERNYRDPFTLQPTGEPGADEAARAADRDSPNDGTVQIRR
jgi:hypothetical protein